MSCVWICDPDGVFHFQAELQLVGEFITRDVHNGDHRVVLWTLDGRALIQAMDCENTTPVTCICTYRQPDEKQDQIHQIIKVFFVYALSCPWFVIFHLQLVLFCGSG